MQDISFSATIRLRKPENAKATWHFVNLPKDISKDIEASQILLPKKRGRKSVRVQARIGFYTWETSIFPSKDTGTYILPLKKEVRKECKVGEGDEVMVWLALT